jgi:hypothetical protein
MRNTDRCAISVHYGSSLVFSSSWRYDVASAEPLVCIESHRAIASKTLDSNESHGRFFPIALYLRPVRAALPYTCQGAFIALIGAFNWQTSFGRGSLR